MKPWTIGHAARTYRMETKIRQGRAANALSEAMKLRHAAWIGSMEAQAYSMYRYAKNNFAVEEVSGSTCKS
jgi:hypothetical protein